MQVCCSNIQADLFLNLFLALEYWYFTILSDINKSKASFCVYEYIVFRHVQAYKQNIH